MNSHTGFTDSDDDEVTGSYECSDPDHCDKGVDCDGEHTYSLEYYRLREGQDDLSEEKAKITVEEKAEITVDGKAQSPLHAVVVDDSEDDDDAGDADPVDFLSDSGDDDPAYDSDDAASCS